MPHSKKLSLIFGNKKVLSNKILCPKKFGVCLYNKILGQKRHILFKRLSTVIYYAIAHCLQNPYQHSSFQVLVWGSAAIESTSMVLGTLINFHKILDMREKGKNKTWSLVSNSSFVLDYKFWLVLVE